MENENADVLRRLRKEQQDRHQSKKAGRDVVESRKKRTKEEKPAELGQQDQPLHRSTASRSKKRPPKHNETHGGMKHLPPNFMIKTKSGTCYKVETRIAEHVYVARNKKTDKLYALKAEMRGQEPENKQLKRDVFVLLDVCKHQSRFTKHFPRLYNKGKVSGICNYIMMTLCDYNLNDLRAQLLDGCDFSRPNAARLCMQTFQAVHDLHSLGFTHRDISPSKFVFGLDNPQIVYMIGFSMAHHFAQHYDTKLTNSPRRLPSKMSNRAFLPRAYHRSKDINRKDDLESWVYVCFNLFGRKILPWNEQFTDLNMFVNKERLFCDGFEECYKYVPRQFQTIMHNLDKLGENERPDYTFIGMMLVTMKENIKFHFYGPFDWQKKSKAHVPGEEKEEGGLAVADKDEAMPTPKKHHQEAAGKRHRGAFQNDEDENESDAEAAVEPKKPEVRKKQKKKASREEVEEEGQPPARSDAKKRQPKAQPPPTSVMQQSSGTASANESSASTTPSAPLITPQPALQPTPQPVAQPAGPSNSELMAQMEVMRRLNAKMAAKLMELTKNKKKEEAEKDDENEEEQPAPKKKSAKKPAHDEQEVVEDKPLQVAQEPSNQAPKVKQPNEKAEERPQQNSEFVLKNMGGKQNHSEYM